jgi:hypothetical protein
MSTSTVITGGSGLATMPGISDSRIAALMKRSREALGPTARTAPAVDEGAVWSFAVTGCSAIDRNTVTRIGKLRGASLELRQCHETRLFRPFLRIDKVHDQWFGRIDYFIMTLMVMTIVGFVLIQYREHLWDLRTLIIQRGTGS